MPEFSHTLRVDAPPEQIFAILDDVTRTPQWLERCTGIDVITPGPPRVGTRLRYHYKDGRQSGVMAGRIVAYEPNRHIAMEYADRMMDVVVDFAAEPAEATASRLTHTITIRPRGLGKVLGPLIARQLPGQTIGAMTRLKRLAEAA